jgi:hypothetical protein
MNQPTVPQVRRATARACAVAEAALAFQPTSYGALMAALGASCPALGPALDARLQAVLPIVTDAATEEEAIAAYRALCAFVALLVYWSCEEANP